MNRFEMAMEEIQEMKRIAKKYGHPMMMQHQVRRPSVVWVDVNGERHTR